MMIRDIKLPMSAEDAKSLKLGEIITVSGLLFTGRSRFHIRADFRIVGIADPVDIQRINLCRRRRNQPQQQQDCQKQGNEFAH